MYMCTRLYIRSAKATHRHLHTVFLGYFIIMHMCYVYIQSWQPYTYISNFPLIYIEYEK